MCENRFVFRVRASKSLGAEESKLTGRLRGGRRTTDEATLEDIRRTST